MKVDRDERRIRFEVCNNAFTKVRLLLNSFFFEGISEPEKHYSLLLAKINYNTLLFYISGIICCHYNEECVKNKKLKKKKCARVLASSLITLIVGFQNPGSYSIFRVTCGRSLQPSFLGSWKFLSTNKRVQTKAISEQKYSSIHLIYFINECIVLSWKGDNNKWKNSISTRKIGNRKQRPWKRVHFIKDQSRIIRVDISVKFQSPIITIMHWFPDNSYTQ